MSSPRPINRFVMRLGPRCGPRRGSGLGVGLTAGSLVLALAVAAVAITPTACSQTREDQRPEVRETITEAVMLPAAQAAEQRAADLRETTASLCGDPSAASLDAAQDAWWQLRGPWRRLRAIPYGPLVDDGFDSLIDFWPARPNSVEGGIEATTGAGEADIADVEALGVASKGLPAIEYLLWDPEGGDAAILASLTGDQGPVRCAYLELLTLDLELRLAELVAAMDVRFAAPGELAMDIDALLNAAIDGLHDLSERSLSKPFGIVSGAPQPEQIESRFSDRSAADIRDAVDGIAGFYLGSEAGYGEGPGFSALVAPGSEAIDARVREQLERAITAAADLPEQLRGHEGADGERVEAAWREIRELRLVLAADVAGLLGVTVSLSDNDGD